MAHADALVLDIGEDVGAVIACTDPGCDGGQLDLTPAGCPRAHELHNIVRRRTTAAGDVVFAAVFPQVPQGRYWLWGTGAEPVAELAVAGGEVTTVHLGGCLCRASGAAQQDLAP